MLTEVRFMKTLLRLLLIVLIFAAGLFLISHYLVEHNSAKTLSQVIQRHYLVLAVWRYVLYGLVLILWPYFIKKRGVRQKWPAQTIIYLSHQRFKLLGLFVFIEVFFVDDFLGHVFIYL